jgi:hypothetical protein
MRWLGMYLGFFAGSASLFAAAKVTWKPIPPDELSSTAPLVEPEAPAELVLWNIEIDDRDFPEVRQVREYLRYKIFVPDKAEQATRISGLAASYDGREVGKVNLRARLVRPDGTTQEFGEESIQERSLMRSGAEQTLVHRLFGSDGVEIKEKFLAVTGIVPGAILEFQTTYTDNQPSFIIRHTLQQNNIPVRKMEYLQKVSRDSDYNHRAFALNLPIGHANFKEDPKARTIAVTATNIPSLVHEPFDGPACDFALTVMSCYTPVNELRLTRSVEHSVHVDEQKTGPWSTLATRMFLQEEDGSDPTERVKKLAAEITKAEATPLEKARRIHNYVQDLYLRFIHLPKLKNPPRPTLENLARSLDDVIDCEKNRESMTGISTADFLWLAIGLYKAAGLDAHTVILPDSSFSHFDRRLIASMFLRFYCAAVRIEGKWWLSYPNSRTYLPFGMVWAMHEGQGGLLAQLGPQEFIEVPSTPAEKTVATNTGTFRLGADGSLSGEGKRRLTGHLALNLRSALRGQGEKKQNSTVRQRIVEDFKGAEVTITKTTGLTDPDAPIEISFKLRIPNFAILTKDRIVFRPSVYRLQSSSPFPAATRQHWVQFPYAWQEIDSFTIETPPGYAPESNTAPTAAPGEVLSYRTRIAFEISKRLVHLRREFSSKVIYVPDTSYHDLKTWYDLVASGDQHELIFIRNQAKDTPQAPTTSPASVPADQPTGEPAAEP